MSEVRTVSREEAIKRRADLLAVAYSLSGLTEPELQIKARLWELPSGLRAIASELDELNFLVAGTTTACCGCLDDGLCVLHDGHEESHQLREEWWATEAPTKEQLL